MIKILSFLFLFVTISAQAASPQLLVNLGPEQNITCQQKSKSNFWVCDGDRLLFIGETIVGQTPTIHDLRKLDVKVPNRIVDIETKKEIFGNPLDFQYQQPNRTAIDSYYRKFNMMMTFEPRLRACAISECRKLKSLLHSLVYKQNQMSATMAANLEVGLEDQVEMLPELPPITYKSTEDLRISFSKIRSDESLRYDYLRDGCFARAQVVSNQLADQGYEVYKIWAHGFSLWGYHDQKPSDFFGWRFHVAPVVRIDGQLWVIDPGFFKVPVKPRQWVNEILGPNAIASVTTQFVEENLAVSQTVAVSLTRWQVYPTYSSTQIPNEQETVTNTIDAKTILEELGL